MHDPSTMAECIRLCHECTPVCGACVIVVCEVLEATPPYRLSGMKRQISSPLSHWKRNESEVESFRLAKEQNKGKYTICSRSWRSACEIRV